MSQPAKRVAFINKLKECAALQIQAAAIGRELRLEWDSQGYGGTFMPEDFREGNDHLDANAVTAMVVTNEAINDFLSANGNSHWTNLYRLPR